jgi:hypothetical protein
MPTITGTQNLTIPVSTDFVEDQWSYHAQMAKQMEQRYNLHDSDAARYSPAPLTIVDCTIQAIYPTSVADNNQYDTMIKFDTIMVDTAGMANLDVVPWALTPQETGMYHFSCYVKILPSGCSTGGLATLNLSARGAAGTVFSTGSAGQGVEMNSAGTTSVSLAGDIAVTVLGKAFGHPIIGFFGAGCTTQQYTPVYARFGMYKVRDL